MLNLVHLKVLAAVARHGSVTEAAKELHYSQPSVSHHLARLEAATGVKLVQRVGRGIRLTPEGRAAGEPGHRDRGASRRGDNELAAQVGLRAGRVRLAVPTRRSEHDRTEGGRQAGPGAPGTRAEPGRPSSGRGAEDAALRRGRRRLDLPARRRPGRGGGIPPRPRGRRPDLPRQRATRRQHRETIATPPGSAVANGVGPRRSPHASETASHHASHTPATTWSSSSRWSPPESASPY